MKKSDIALIIGVVVVLIIGGFVMKGSKASVDYELPLKLTGEAGLHQISYAEYKAKIDNGESFVFIVERATCSHCVNFMPVAENFAKDEGVPMYYVDTDTFGEEEWAEFEKTNSFFKKHVGNWGTPTTIVLAGSSAVDVIEGETSSEKLKKLYEKYFDLESYKNN